MAYKTLMLQIYKPSGLKKDILDQALLNYSKALQFLLEKYKSDIENFSESGGQVSRGMLLALIDKDTVRKLNEFNVQPFKDSLKIDFVQTAATYIAQKKKEKNTGYPNLFVDSQTGLHSLYFGRYAVNRDYCLLYDQVTDRFYAKLYLLNLAQSHHCQANLGRLSLRYVFKELSPMVNQAGKKRYLIVPLAMGRKQYNELKKTLNNPSILRTARISKKNNKYYLMVNIECAVEQPIKTITTMGVARNAKGGLHYTICAQNGEIVDEGCLYSDRADQRLFILAGNIIKIATEHQAKVILEASGGKNDKVIHSDGSEGPLTTYQYKRLVKILEYKLPEKRLPPPVQVSANALYWTCPQCGNRTHRNCLSSEIFACIECGFASASEVIGSTNLARRLEKYASDKVPIYVADTLSGRLYYNNNIDFKCVLPSDSTNQEKIFYELSLLVHAYNQFEKDTKKYAILKKLINSPSMRDVIRIVGK